MFGKAAVKAPAADPQYQATRAAEAAVVAPAVAGVRFQGRRGSVQPRREGVRQGLCQEGEAQNGDGLPEPPRASELTTTPCQKGWCWLAGYPQPGQGQGGWRAEPSLFWMHASARRRWLAGTRGAGWGWLRALLARTQGDCVLGKVPVRAGWESATGAATDRSRSAGGAGGATGLRHSEVSGEGLGVGL